MVTCALCKCRLADALEDEGGMDPFASLKASRTWTGSLASATCLRCDKKLLEATTAAAVAIMKDRAK